MVKSLPLTYTRPKHVEQHELQRTESLPSSSEKTDGSVKSGKSGYSSGIPESLGFDRIINGGTCPVSLPFPNMERDFGNVDSDH